MEAKSRTEHSARNTSVAMISKIAAILMGFFTRVVFIHTLNENYVGINGLFTDILNVLALSELGLGTAITYALYRPIAEGNIEKIKSLMRLYRRLYRLVALFVGVMGLAVIPFFDVIMKNQPQVEHLTLIYLLYLANSVLSYLLIYKRTLLDANQLIYIGTMYQTVFYLIQDILQMAVLVLTGNFILFLVIYLVCTLGSNICISRKADRLYPYLKEREVQPLEQSQRREIMRNMKAMLMHKLGDVVVNNTDNLLLSAFVGIVSVGKYSNYYLLIGSIRQVFDQTFRGITASVGNLGVTEKEERVQRIFEGSCFVGQWFYGLAAICLFELLNPFVEISFGASYLFTRDIVLILCINFFVRGMYLATLVFRDSLGLFWFDRYKSIVEAVLNLVLSILFVQWYGTFGVFLGTFISMAATSMWVEPYVLYRHCLKTSPFPYFKQYAGYALVLSAVWYATDRLCILVSGSAVFVFLIRFVICAVVPNLLFLVIYHRTKEFAFIKGKLLSLLKKYKGGKRE